MLYQHKIGVIKKSYSKLYAIFALLILLSTFFSTKPRGFEESVNAMQITNHVVINEVVANPSTGEIEWVELYNPTNSSIDMTGWRIRLNASGNFSGVFAAGTTIAPHSFLVREKTTSTALTNSGATLYLEKSANASDVDTVTYPILASGQSYARIYDSESTFEIRSAVETTKNTSNGTLPPPSFIAEDSKFIGDPKYVRVNHTNDLSAAVSVPAPTTDVRFHFDGLIDINNVAGTQHIQTGQWPTAQGIKQFRAYTPLPAGKYIVTAEYFAYDSWHPVTGSNIAYSLDTPWATVVSPTLSNKYFRPSDNAVRIRVDDEFNQFNYMVFKLNDVKYLVTRDQCDLRQAGNYLLCDAKNANARTQFDIAYPSWPQLPSGTYSAQVTTVTKANNRSGTLTTEPFVIDTERPTITNFVITSQIEDFSTHINVRADATDDNGLKYVQFYITNPRISDGTCDGNGIPTRRVNGVLDSDSTYEASVDTSGLSGDICINAISKDLSMHTSNLIERIKVSL